MNKININDQIKAARKLKGLTQQELADEAGISLRTIQRIEKGTEEISGFSLKQISKVLDIPLENLIMQNVNEISIDSNQIGSIKTLYLSSLLFILLPFLGFIIPSLIGFTKENKNTLYKKHFRFILLLQGIQSIIILCLVCFYLPFILFTSTSSPQQINITMPNTESMILINEESVQIERQDSIYIIRNFNSIDSLKRTKILQQNLISMSADSIKFYDSEYDTIASIIGVKTSLETLKVTDPQVLDRNRNETSSEINWLKIILIFLIAAYYIANIVIIVVQVNKLTPKKNN
ncbi:helix-turn-helix domain-containing protein [Sphingobacterium bovistauri]|uniref:Helix-turn-helix transcriptional regulator n=1 Tax=Sphingobacterium bovistauri TaxID=2781959 RepID=A0ABS7Z2M5_9SPHI|nr:helix-turn-helix transcriptional regulator [Sphingobacterium bovistauri]MCA5004233.1 helix-turn-helix transcriptional regulator [Sphingobacterium bovistauri]